ncbi:MAG: type III secretion system cytoplasmic ring protein SctQ [Deltaproteobacteria bacterium]|jgi:type III secretion protein Q|nr:type III secretion system cytoplasmic ring protein SctQ [Deltaproteobacteria bacterium]
MYPIPALNRDLALLISSISQRFDHYALASANGILTFAPIPDQHAWRPVGAIDFEANGFDWRLFLGSWDILSGRSDLDGLSPEDLPDYLRLAASALVLQPALAALELALETRVALVGPGGLEDSEDDGLEFRLKLAEGRGYVPLKIRPPGKQAAQWLLGRLENRSPKDRLDIGGLKVPVSLLAGEMSMPLSLVRDLGVGDILLPPVYPALENQLLLKIKGRPAIRLKNGEGSAQVVMANFDTKERHVQDAASDVKQIDQSAETAAMDQDPIIENIDDLEVVVGFELGKLDISLKELTAMAVGTVFPLDVDLSAPVTLTVNDQPVAQGRLVDLDGTVGVQVVRVAGGR